MGIRKGDKVSISGEVYVCTNSSDEWTEDERQAGALRALELLEWAGIPPVSDELLAAKARRDGTA